MKNLLMNNKVLLLCLISFLSYKVIADGQQSQLKTYYYELVKVVDKNGKEEERSGDGQFYTITHNTCYESNNQGLDEGLGHLSYVGEHSATHSHVFSGQSYYGQETTFYFNSDYSRINIKTSAGRTYVLSRKVAPKSFLASDHRENVERLKAVINGQYIPPIPSTITNTTTPSDSHRRCAGCNGTGLCSMCQGKGWYMYQGEIYDCPSCHRTGRCGVCHGKGHCN